jgi:uncharacterized protein YdaU (DUF1376 family)
MTHAWYPFYWSDYSGKTLHLSQGEHGAYMLLLRWVYTTGTPVPANQAHSIARALLEHERENVDSVLRQFFIESEHGWVNERAFEVIQQNEKHQRRVSAGKRGGKQKSARPKQSYSNAKAMLGQCSSNQNQNQNQNKKEVSSSSRDDGLIQAFTSLWSKWPRKVGKGAAVKAYGKALKRAKPEEIAAGVDRALPTLSPDPQFVPHLATWLNQDRWLDEQSVTIAADPEMNNLRQQAKLLASLTPFAKSHAKKLPAGAIPKMVKLGLLPAETAAEYGVKS